MINEFKKYDKEHTRLVTISVSDFNELIKYGGMHLMEIK